MKTDTLPPPLIRPAALRLAAEVLAIEAKAVSDLAARLDHNFLNALDLILGCRGRVVVSGMGKSGHIGRKIAATLASTGTPAFFMHPAEAIHGDLGMLQAEDVLLALSNSGESSEIVTIMPLVKRRGARLIAMTGNARSTLAREADVHLDVSVSREACPLNLAPTASTTAALALGDALAVAALDARGFSSDDFARTHPGGALGRRLLVHVSDIMRTGTALPRVSRAAALKEVLLEMSQKGLGMTAIVDPDNRVEGVFTDGDLRRILDRGDDLHSMRAAEVMTCHPSTITSGKLAAEAVKIMEERQVNGLLVVDEEGRLVGALNMHDLLRAGVV